MTTENGTHSCQAIANQDSMETQTCQPDCFGADPDEILIEQFIIGEQGLHIDTETLEKFKLKPGSPVHMVISENQVLVSSDSHIRNMLNAAQELQLRQDEQKQNYSNSIRTLVRYAYKASGIPMKKANE